MGSGMTQAQYAQMRADEAAKKAKTYQKNVAKGGKFQVFTDWYSKRGTNEQSDWMSRPNSGHTMAKTKYDWSGKRASQWTFPSGLELILPRGRNREELSKGFEGLGNYSGLGRCMCAS